MNAAGVVLTLKGGGGTQTLLAVKNNFTNLLHPQAAGIQKLWLQGLIPGHESLHSHPFTDALPLAPNEPPGGISTTLFCW